MSKTRQPDPLAKFRSLHREAIAKPKAVNWLNLLTEAAALLAAAKSTLGTGATAIPYNLLVAIVAAALAAVTPIATANHESLFGGGSHPILSSVLLELEAWLESLFSGATGTAAG